MSKFSLQLIAVEVPGRVAGEIIGAITMMVPSGLSADQITVRYLDTANQYVADMVAAEVPASAQGNGADE